MAGDSGELMAGDEVTGIGRAGSQVGTRGDKRWWDLSLWSSWQLPQDWAEQAANSDDGGDDDGHQTGEFRRNHQHGSHTAKRLTHTVPYNTHTHTHTLLTALCPGLPGRASTREVKPIWILLKQETVSGSGISWTVCKSAPHSRQITTPAPHHSVFYRPDALRAAQPTASKHWRHSTVQYSDIYNLAKGKRVPK